MKKIVCIMMAVLTVFAVLAVNDTAGIHNAFADIGYGDVYITGDVNMRDEPSVDGYKLCTLSGGSTVSYGGQQSTDDRGVVWYKVSLSDGTVGWISSKYAELDESASGYEQTSGNDLYTVVERIPAGEVYTREQVAEWYGVFSYNELINVDHVNYDTGNGMQTLRIYLEEEVFWGGTDGYAEDWLACDGILTEGVADIDGDGTEEYLVLYLDSNYVSEYDYTRVDNIYTFAVFEPVTGGYVFADDMVLEPGYMNERFIRYFEGANGNYIVQGNIGYWDGGAGGMNAYLYGYDGSELYGAAAFIASTDGSYAFSVKCDPEDLEQMVSDCDMFEYDPDTAAKWGLKEGINYMHVDGCYDIWDYETNKLNMESFAGIEAVSEIAAGWGIDMGYVIEHGEWEGYDLYMNCGADMF